MGQRTDSPFGSIESSHEYLALLLEAIGDAKAVVDHELQLAANRLPGRRGEAYQLVAYKLDQLRCHLVTSRRLLNDLRSLRRLLSAERAHPDTPARHSGAPDLAAEEVVET